MINAGLARHVVQEPLFIGTYSNHIRQHLVCSLQSAQLSLSVSGKCDFGGWLCE